MYVFPVSFLLTALLACAPAPDKGDDKVQEKGKVSKEDVTRQIGEAYETTKQYLGQKKDGVAESVEERLKIAEEKIDLLREKAAETQQQGRETADATLQILREKQEVARQRYEEFKKSAGEFKDEAGLKLEKALEDLEEAYRRARERDEDDER
jgi:tryptophanyl-tRNA synthetase